MKVLFFLLLVFSASGWAENKPQVAVDNTDKKVKVLRDPTAKVYSKESQLTVDNINKTVEVIRDPTEMSNNFRQALRNLPNYSSAQDKDASTSEDFKALGLPEIELVAKVFSENGPPTVVLKAKGKYHHFEEGDKVSKVIKNQVITIHIQEISKNGVRLVVMPFNKILILN